MAGTFEYYAKASPSQLSAVGKATLRRIGVFHSDRVTEGTIYRSFKLAWCYLRLMRFALLKTFPI